MHINCLSKKSKEGFTLIELLVVISIIGLLSTVILASLQNVRKDAQWRKFESELVEIRTAINLYRSKNDNWPSSIPTNSSPYKASINTVLDELKNSGVYPNNQISLPVSNLIVEIYPSYKLNNTLSTLWRSCGNGNYYDNYYIIQIYISGGGSINDTKLPRMWMNGVQNPGMFYCMEIK